MVTKLVNIPENYIEQVYAGWLGKTIGVRHGANIENWTYDRILKAFGTIEHYLYDFKNFAADDDTNGPIFFLRALEDYTHTQDITAEEMGNTWLNYVPDGHGFFWWGGYGVSTEDTAYKNLKSGIKAPQSGSIEQNGTIVAEQIGGQIFIDVWGLIAPNNPKLAADYAEKMASVSHDGNGKYGGMFIAACVAAAFGEKDMKKIIEAGLSVIPEDCTYAIIVRDIIKYYEEHPHNWRDCYHYIYDTHGYDKYGGVCHIIPNSAVMILSLLYGEGDFTDTINICNMCGWDTDCNVGNVGTIMGVRNGLEGIDPSWREPINDFLCCSSVVGSLNILDLPWCATYTAKFGYLIAGEKPTDDWWNILNSRHHYHFELPGSTHSVRTEADSGETQGFIVNDDTASYSGNRSLKVMYDHVNGGYGYRTYIQTYYRPDDFDDNRYEPSFSPILYPGQTIEVIAKKSEDTNMSLKARLFVYDSNNKEYVYSADEVIEHHNWVKLTFNIPSMKNALIEKAGIEFVPLTENGFFDWPNLNVYIDSITFIGNPTYDVDFKQEEVEAWTLFQSEISQFTKLRGLWTIEDGSLVGSNQANESAEIYTGDIDWEDYTFETELKPLTGEKHLVTFRVQGAIRSYAAGFTANNKLSLYKKDIDYTLLTEVDFNWSNNETYHIAVDADKGSIRIIVDGKELLSYHDEAPYRTGMIGFANHQGSRTSYQSFKLTSKNE